MDCTNLDKAGSLRLHWQLACQGTSLQEVLHCHSELQAHHVGKQRSCIFLYSDSRGVVCANTAEGCPTAYIGAVAAGLSASSGYFSCQAYLWPVTASLMPLAAPLTGSITCRHASCDQQREEKFLARGRSLSLSLSRTHARTHAAHARTHACTHLVFNGPSLVLSLSFVLLTGICLDTLWVSPCIQEAVQQSQAPLNRATDHP